MLRFSATLILTLSILISATLTVRFMMMQGANSEIDTLLNIGMGLILAIAEVVFTAMLAYSYGIGQYFLSILFLFTTGPLVVASIVASNLQLLDSQSKTEHYAMVNDAGYNALLQMQKGYSEQINQIRSHPYYNENNPVNKKRFDEQISSILARQEAVSQQIANFNPTTLESGNGFQVMGEWLGMSANQFKQNVFFGASILLEAVMLLCTLFLTVTSSHTGKNHSTNGPSNRPRKGLFRKLFSSFKLPSIVQQPTSLPNGARALNIQENINKVGRNIPEYSVEKSPLNFNVADDLIVNLAKFPHIIIAGVTNSGKSNFLKGMISQLISQNSPEKLRILPVDLKEGATLFRFKDIPHFEKPLATSNADALKYLEWLEHETARRQKLLTAASCEDVVEYTKEYGKEPFPHLLAVFEEVAFLSDYDKSVRPRLSSVASKARSAAISLVLSTQYPRKDVLDSKITANCSGRFCFYLESVQQSLVVIGQKGAESLTGSGHGIFKHGGFLTEFRSPLWNKVAVQNVVDGVISNYGKNIPQSNIIPFPKNIHNNTLNIQENIPETENTMNIPNENIQISELAKKLRNEGKKQTEIGEILGIPQGTVSKLLRKA